MRSSAITLAALLGAALLGVAMPAAAADDVVGTWLTEGGRAQVRMAPCGTARCGTVIWTKAPRKDANNPTASLRDRDLVGVQLVSDAKPAGEGWAGSLYNPEDGRTYSGTMKLRGASLDVSGCVLGGLICRTQTWTRAR